MSNNFKFCPVCGSRLYTSKSPPLPPPTPYSAPRSSGNLPVGKIIGISVLVFFLVGGAYLWLTEISPEIQRINASNQRIAEQNNQVIQDRGFGPYDCYYNENSKVNNCILRYP